MRAAAAATLLSLLVPPTAPAQEAPADDAPRSWTLTSGAVTYRLATKHGRVALDYFGPTTARSPAAPAARWDSAAGVPLSDELAGFEDRSAVALPVLRLVSDEARTPAPGVRELRFVFRHAAEPLEVEARYTAWGETGVFTRRLVLRNQGPRPLPIESSSPLLAWELPPGEYTMRSLYGSWGAERQVAVERVAVGARRFEQRRGRSSNGVVPWLSLRDEGRGVEYLVDLAWSGNWWAQVERGAATWRQAPRDQPPLAVRVGLHHDFGGAIVLAPGEELELPAVAVTAARGDLDDAANRMHRWQREFVVPRAPANDPPLVQFNSWYPFNDRIDAATLERTADVAATLGAEVFVVDAGWFSDQEWTPELGDYVVNRRKFPRGLEALSAHVRSKGMKFGLWVEIENAGLRSRLYRDHPDWCLSYAGRPAIAGGDRCPLDFAKPAVRRWARATVDRLVRDHGLDWIKIDYNADVGDRFDAGPAGSADSADSAGHAGGRLHDHLVAYYRWLDELRAAHPDLIVENCASGGLRFDTGMMAHAHVTWLSDDVDPVSSLALQYGCTLQFSAGLCNHWMVGDTDRGVVKPGAAPGWWDFMFRVPMNGQFGISSRVLDWSPALRERAAANVALYKRVRATIVTGDVYHLTPPPALDDPRGWMALQYVAPDGARSVVTAYRLAGGAASATFRLRGLRPETEYEIARDGQVVGRARGAELAGAGLQVASGEEWRGAVLEVTARGSGGR